jgi:hypothetical protein
VAVGTPRVPEGKVERAAPQHTVLIIGRLQLLALCPLFGIARIGISAPQTPRPLPHIPSYIQQPLGAGSLWIRMDRCGLIQAAFLRIALPLILLVAPGIDAAVRAPCSLFPFYFAW